MANSGIGYEAIVQSIFDAVINQDRVETIEVEHDVDLRGKDTVHHIDLLWRFLVGGIEYTTIVQAKDWDQPLSQGQVLLFKSVLNDLPHQPRGIMVTKTGYQSGAAEVAKSNGILLYRLDREVREPIQLPAGSVSTLQMVPAEEKPVAVIGIDLLLTPRVAQWSEVKFQADRQWVQEELVARGESSLPVLDLPKLPLGDIRLYSKPGAFRETLQKEKLAEVFKVALDENVEEKAVSIDFAEPTFIETGSPIIPMVKVRSMTAKVKVQVLPAIRAPMHTKGFVRFVLENLATDRDTSSNCQMRWSEALGCNPWRATCLLLVMPRSLPRLDSRCLAL